LVSLPLPPSNEEARKMARRRYQRGHVFLRGKRGQRVWVGRYLEGITPAGKRINKSVVLGEGKDFSGKKMALRALEPYLKKVNDINYRPATPVTFEEFAKTWKDTVAIVPTGHRLAVEQAPYSWSGFVATLQHHRAGAAEVHTNRFPRPAASRLHHFSEVVEDGCQLGLRQPRD